MDEIKILLNNLVKDTIIPEVNEYLNDLHKLLEEDNAKEDDMLAIREMESFLVELENILLAIKENKMDNSQAQEIYNKLQNLIEESKKH